MSLASKSPFRRLLEIEGFDSQSSFNLPSPRLVEHSEAPTPELYTIDLDPADSSCNLPELRIEEPKQPLSPLEKFQLTPVSVKDEDSAVSPGMKFRLGEVHKRLRKRSTPLSYYLHRQLLCRARESKNDSMRMKLSKDSPAVPALSMVKKRVLSVQRSGKSPLAVHLLAETPKAQPSKLRASENKKLQSRVVKEPQLRPTRILVLPKRVAEKGRYDIGSPINKAEVRPHPPYRSQEGKSPVAKDRRSLTPADRVAVR